MGVKRNLDAAGMSVDTTNMTEEEAALYDRQIRLWGMQCQKRLREANVLVIGLNGVAAELVKNITLSGIKSITIMDETPVKQTDFTAQFFLAGCELGQSRADASKTAIQELNPNVKVIIDKEEINKKTENFFSDFNAVCCFDLPVNVLVNINNMCRKNSVLFYCGDSWGFYGYFFLDLQSHTFTWMAKEGDKKEKAHIKKVDYCSLECALSAKCDSGIPKRCSKVYILLHILNLFRQLHNRYPAPGSRDADIIELKSIRNDVTKQLGYDETKITDEILSTLFAELSPVCAAVGGALANEVVKGIARKSMPVLNFFFFDGEECVGVVEPIIGNPK